MEYGRTWGFAFDIYWPLGIQEKIHTWSHFEPLSSFIFTQIWNLFYSNETWVLQNLLYLDTLSETIKLMSI